MILPFPDEVDSLFTTSVPESDNVLNATMTALQNNTTGLATDLTIATNQTESPTLSGITTTVDETLQDATTALPIGAGQFLVPELTTSGLLDSVLNDSAWWNYTLNTTVEPMANVSNSTLSGSLAAPLGGCAGNYSWIWTHFGQCVLTPVQVGGFAIGLVSIMAWVVAHVFYIQAVTIDHRHSPARISLLGLSFVLAADFLNFAGAVTSNQLPTMVIVSVYLFVMDFVRFTHSFLLRMGGKQWCYEQVNSRYQERWDRFFLVCPWLLSTATYLFGPFLLEVSKVEMWPPKSTDMILVHRSRILLQVDELESSSNVLNAGYVMGVLMVPLYFASVIPELIKVFQCRRSTPHMVVYYVAALLGDVFYLTSIYTQSLETNFLLQTLPWTVARTGVCGLHIGVLIQICIAKGTYTDEEEVRMSLLSKRFDDSDDETLFVRDPGIDVGRDEIEMDSIPKRNRYIKKMKKIGQQIDGSNPFDMVSSEDDGFSDDEQTSLMSSSPGRQSRDQKLTGPRQMVVISDHETDSDAVSLNLDLDPETLQRPLSEDEISWLLDSEYQHLDQSKEKRVRFAGNNSNVASSLIPNHEIRGIRVKQEERNPFLDVG